MPSLRPSSALLRLVLACYLLVLGIAGASPVVHPLRMEMVCHGDGVMTLVVADHELAGHEAGQHTLDCSLCLPAALPAPPAQIHQAFAPPLGSVLAPMQAAQIAARIGARFPPRGPPAFA